MSQACLINARDILYRIFFFHDILLLQDCCSSLPRKKSNILSHFFCIFFFLPPRKFFVKARTNLLSSGKYPHALLLLVPLEPPTDIAPTTNALFFPRCGNGCVNFFRKLGASSLPFFSWDISLVTSQGKTGYGERREEAVRQNER